MSETPRTTKCPTCGWPIAEGTVTHLCPIGPIVTNEGAYTSSVSVGPFDVVVLNRRSL